VAGRHPSFPDMSDHTRHYRADIDGLRAVAVALVIAHHVAPEVFPGGFVGVDVFFVISGFLITGILERSIRSGSFRYVEFLWRRCRRIVPALIVTLLGTLALGCLVLTGPELMSLAPHTAAAALSGSNIFLWSEVGYFDATAATKPLLHLWSLGVEEQFYLLWPLLLFSLPRGRRKRLIAVFTLIVVSLIASEYMAYTAPPHAFYLADSRAWELAAGGLLGMTATLRRTLPFSPRTVHYLHDIASALGIVLILLAELTSSSRDAWPGFAALLPVLGAVCVIAAGPASLVNRSLLATRLGVWLGKRSYPLYLWHWPPLALLHIVAGENTWVAQHTLPLAIGLTCASVALAHLTHEFVERPVQRRAIIHAATQTVTARRLVPYALTLLVMIAISGGVILEHGIPVRYSDSGADATTVLRAASTDSIVSYARTAARCKLADAGTATWCWRIAGSGRGVAVFGDSHAEVLFAGLAEQQIGVPLFLTGRKGCAPVINEQPIADQLAEICRKSALIALSAIRADTAIGTVLLVSRGPAYLSGGAFGIDSMKPVVQLAVARSRDDTLTLTRAYEAGITRTVRALQGAGKRVIFVLDVPELGFNPEECVIGRPLGLRTVRRPCAVTRSLVDQRNARYRALTMALQQRLAGLELYDAAAPLCDRELCKASLAGQLLYSDANHLTIAGSRLVTAPLASMIARPRGAVAAAR
jgi:peptidoglycan/LPS O-acetylase OafA/YrhL